MPYVCRVCNARISRLCHLRKHIRRIHPSADLQKLLEGFSDKYEFVHQTVLQEYKRRQEMGINTDDFKIDAVFL